MGSVVVCFRAGRELAAFIDEVARVSGMSRSEAIREMIEAMASLIDNASRVSMLEALVKTGVLDRPPWRRGG